MLLFYFVRNNCLLRMSSNLMMEMSFCHNAYRLFINDIPDLTTKQSLLYGMGDAQIFLFARRKANTSATRYISKKSMA